MRDYCGRLPFDAVSSDGIYVAQLLYNASLLPAILYPDIQEAVTDCTERKIQIKVFAELASFIL